MIFHSNLSYSLIQIAYLVYFYCMYIIRFLLTNTTLKLYRVAKKKSKSRYSAHRLLIISPPLYFHANKSSFKWGKHATVQVMRVCSKNVIKSLRVFFCLFFNKCFLEITHINEIILFCTMLCICWLLRDH